MSRRGRPLGPKAQAVLQTIGSAPLPISTLALRLQLSYADATQTVQRLTRAGHAEFGAAVHYTGGRPARLVQLSGSSATSASFDALRIVWRSL